MKEMSVFFAAFGLVCAWSIEADAGNRRLNVNEREELKAWGINAAPSKAPRFLLQGLDGRDISSSDYEDGVLIVSFFTGNCKTCLVEMRMLGDFYRKYGNEKLGVIGIDVDPRVPTQQVVALARALKISFPVAIDRRAQISDMYNPIRELPYAVILSKGTVVAYKRNGFRASRISEIKGELDRLVPPEEVPNTL